MARTKDGLTRQGHVEISRGFIKALRAERDRTGMSPPALLRRHADKPAYLTAAMISNWMSGQTKTAHPEHMAFVIEAYRQAYDNEGRKKR